MNRANFLYGVLCAALIGGSLLLPSADGKAQKSSEYAAVCKNTLALFYEGPGSEKPFSEAKNLPDALRQAFQGQPTRREIGKLVSSADRNAACNCMQNAFNQAGTSKNYIIEESINYSDNGHEYLSIRFDGAVNESMGQSDYGRHSNVLGDFMRGLTGQKSARQQIFAFQSAARNCSKLADPRGRGPFEASARNAWWTSYLYE